MRSASESSGRVLASRPDRTRVDVNACTCRTIVLAVDLEDRDGWTQQVVYWNKKLPGAKSGRLGHLFESQKVRESTNQGACER